VNCPPNGSLAAASTKGDEVGKPYLRNNVPFATRPLYSRGRRLSIPMNRHLGLPTFLTPLAGTGAPSADKGQRIEKVNRPRPRLAGFPNLAPLSPSSRHPAGLTAPQRSGLIQGWGAVDEGENNASNDRREGRSTVSEKFNWRPVAPTKNAIPYRFGTCETTASAAMIVSWAKGVFSICPYPNRLTHNGSIGSEALAVRALQECPRAWSVDRDDLRRRLSGTPVAGFLRLALRMVLLVCGFHSQAF
jgi:hypothetical protein